MIEFTGMQGRRPNGEHKTRSRKVITLPRDGQHKGQSNTTYSDPTLANPGNIIRCIVGGGVMGHENEAPFPEKLAEFFVRSFCPPGGLVYDPFAGSGTTLAVAKRTGREWIGTDVRQSQVDLATRRVAEAQRELIG